MSEQLLEERIKELEKEIRKVLAEDDRIISYDSVCLYGLRELMRESDNG